MPVLLLVALGLYVLATGLGLLMRVAFVVPVAWLDLSNAVHAHSHTLYFGWAGLAILALAFRRVGDDSRLTRGLLWTVAGLSLAAFVSFLQGGYSVLSIVISSAFLVVWGVAIARWWRAARGERGLDLLYLRVGLGYLALAAVGACVRTVLLIGGPEDPLPGRLAVFSFLHNFQWFFIFAAVGLLLSYASRLGITLDEGRLRRHLLWAAPLAWITFPLGVLGGGEVPLLGPAARVASLVLAWPGLLLGLTLFSASRAGGGVGLALRWLGGWYLLKVAMETGGALGLADVAVAARQPALIYLHVVLLGFVTQAVLLPLRHELRRPLGQGLNALNAGLAVMLAGLAVVGAPFLGLPALAQWMTAGFVVAALGGGVAFVAGASWLLPGRTLQQLARSDERRLREAGAVELS